MPHHELASPRAPLQLPVSGECLRVLVFRLADRFFALPAAAIREIIPFAQLSEPPGLPSDIAGFLQVGVSSLPVLRMAHLFGLPETPPGLYTPLLILRSEEAPLALWVDTVEQIVVAELGALRPLPEGYALNECVLGTISLDAGQTLLLDERRLLRREHELRLARIAVHVKSQEGAT